MEYDEKYNLIGIGDNKAECPVCGQVANEGIFEDKETGENSRFFVCCKHGPFTYND